MEGGRWRLQTREVIIRLLKTLVITQYVDKVRTIEQTIFRNRHIIECRQGLEIQFDLECSVLPCAECDVLEEMYAVTTM